MKRPNRNDACWCGSDLKYKKCHLASDEELGLKLFAFQKQGYEIPTWELIKTPAEIDGIRKSCQLTKKILDELTAIVKPGVSTEEINQFVHEYTLKNNAIPAPLNYRGYPKSCCTSINEVICHGIPSSRKLIEGDIVNIDVTCILDGFYGDSNRMYLVGKISNNAKKLVDVTRECLDLGIAAVKPFEPINKIGEAIEKHAKKYGFSVVKDYGGHGIGRNFHEDPFIYHYARKEKEMIMAPNMVFTIEPMINEGRFETKLLADKWTAITIDGKLSAQWEHTVRVTENGVEVLSA